jgi:hypothetical protein
LKKKVWASNPWNTFFKSEMDNFNAGESYLLFKSIKLWLTSHYRERGQKYRLSEYMKEHGADVKQKFARLLKAKRDELVKDIDVL